MTVAELIEELQKYPAYYPVLCDGPRVAESIRKTSLLNQHQQVGFVVLITPEPDKRNDQDYNEW